MTLEGNTEGFLVQYNGLVLTSAKDPKATISVPGPQGTSSHFFVTVQCGYNPIKTPQVWRHMRSQLCILMSKDNTAVPVQNRLFRIMHAILY